MNSYKLITVATAFSAALAAGGARAQSDVANVPTFNRDIAPIIFNHCAACHRNGQIGPFPLTSYDEVARRARQIARVTESCIMPPWLPHVNWAEFRHTRTLSESEIATLRKWVAGGKPEGKAAHLPPMPKFKDGWHLGEPDMILTMQKPFTVPTEGRDVYVHFVFPLNFEADKYLRGVEIIPSNKRVAHHAVGILDTSGKARMKAAANDGHSYFGNAPGFLPAGFTPGFVPGQTPGFFAEGEGITLKKGSDFVLQMHYHSSGREETDQTKVGLYFAKTPPKRAVSMFLLGSSDIDIPPGEKAYRRTDSYKLAVDFEVRTIWAHMHLIGKEAKVWAELPDQTTRKLLWIPNWDFNWQDTYAYVEPFVLPAGTIVKAEFLWDNSADNPRNPFSPPQRILNGEQSTDEMGGIIIGGLPVDQNKEWLHWLSVGGHWLEIEMKKPKK